MKRIISAFFICVFLCTIYCSAQYYSQEIVPVSEVVNEVEEEKETVEEEVEQKEVVEETTPEKKTEEVEIKTIEMPSEPPEHVLASKITSETQDYASIETVEIEMVEEEEESEELEISQITPTVSHSKISSEQYYQYSALSSEEKNAYRCMSQAIQAGERIVNLEEYNCSIDTTIKVYRYVVADNPQYFYLAKSFAYTYNVRSGMVKQLIVLYNDGTTEDKYDTNGQMISTANRELINQQVNLFNEKVSDILRTIPISATEIEKEKKIYDYLQANIEYDYDAASIIGSSYEVLPHAFDVYGAACEGMAVCEGYAELFQYLCYCVGINATQVYGTASGGSHMWNAVQIENAWYMLDVTWDDYGYYENMYCYTYFNVTTSKISRDHTIDTESINVPKCDSIENAFYHTYALYTENIRTAPSNYEIVIDNLVHTGDAYLCIYVGNLIGPVQYYLTKQIMDINSEMQKYIVAQNYTIVLDESYIPIGDYCYIKIK